MNGTERVRLAAIKSFQHITGVAISDASQTDVLRWLHALRASGKAINTCRAYLSMLNGVTGLQIAPIGLPAPVRGGEILSDEQVRALIVAMKPHDRNLFIGLLAGRSSEYTRRELARRLKRYAGLAGLQAENVTLRVWLRSKGRMGAARAAAQSLAVCGVDWGAVEIPQNKDPRLHGIGRRGGRSSSISQ
jgi:hypothetical protein